ncbi:MAG: PspA/IM30 family protein [Parahaliea sp.]
MNIWAKMITALRGGINETGEAIIDSQALRILDQEIRDSAEELKNSKDSLAEILARQKVAEKKCSHLNQQIKEHESYAVEALKKNNDDLAKEVAEKIADLENQHTQESESARAFQESAASLRQAVKQAEQNLKNIKQQVDTVKATENVQRAQAAVAERHSGSQSKMQTAIDSLERIKEKQALKAAQLSAARELAAESDDLSLQTRLSEAGITPRKKSADEILQRLKK